MYIHLPFLYTSKKNVQFVPIRMAISVPLRPSVVRNYWVGVLCNLWPKA